MTSALTFRPEDTAARVRLIADHAAGNSLGGSRRFRAGEVVHVVRGSAQDVWWTSYDVDGAYAIPVEKAEILGRSYYWDPLPGSYTWNRATDAEREFWTRARAEGRAADAEKAGPPADLRPIELGAIDKPEYYDPETGTSLSVI